MNTASTGNEMADAGVMTHTRRGARHGRRLHLSAAAFVIALVAAACAPGSSTSINPLVGQLTTRAVDVSVSGTTSYSVSDAPSLASGGPAGFDVTYNSSSLVTNVAGTLEYDSGTGAGPSLRLNIETNLVGTNGTANVSDPSQGVSVSVTGAVSGFSVDDLGNVSGSISNGATTVTFGTTSLAAPGEDPALESLLATESDFCADAQQRLTGADPAELPLSSIANTRESSRALFASSKATLSPLTTRTWTDATDVTSSAGDNLTISKHISCKTRSADHVATLGITTNATDAQCSVLNQRAIDLALAEMTPAQGASVTLPNLGADVVRSTGNEWTTPLAAASEFSGNTLRAHALLTRWTDPSLVLFPDSIRGVHYCTTWSPAYMYTHLLSTISNP